MPDRYCIKDGYIAQASAHTVEASPGDYWQPWRVRESARYQYDVYRAARVAADEAGLRTVADVGCGTGVKLHHFFEGFDVAAFDQPTVEPLVRRYAPSACFCPIDLAAPTPTDARFDLVICADVVEHLLDPDPCMNFLRAITDRLCFISTPERDIVRGPDCMGSVKNVHVREWNAREFAAYVHSRGFEILRHELLPPARLDADASIDPDAISRTTHGCQLIVCRPIG
ncbi:MAG: hypothetical protein Kow0022_06340 [Phycisphaerales bacterium]